MVLISYRLTLVELVQVILLVRILLPSSNSAVLKKKKSVQVPQVASCKEQIFGVTKITGAKTLKL